MFHGRSMKGRPMRRNRIFRDPYSAEEIEAVVENYDELQYLRYKSWVQVRLMDIDMALRSLRPKHYEAVLLCGMFGLTVRTAGILVGVSKDTMHRRYVRGLGDLARFLNGGT
jgi:DNA-directed RNA polymerase specialized sigma24 family protein